MSIESVELSLQSYDAQAEANLQHPYTVGIWDSGHRLANLILIPFPGIFALFQTAIGTLAGAAALVTAGYLGQETMRKYLWSASQSGAETFILLLRTINPRAPLGFHNERACTSPFHKDCWELTELRTPASISTEAAFLQLRDHDSFLVRHVASRVTALVLKMFLALEKSVFVLMALPAAMGSLFTLGSFRPLNDFAYRTIAVINIADTLLNTFICFLKILNPWSQQNVPLSVAPQSIDERAGAIDAPQSIDERPETIDVPQSIDEGLQTEPFVTPQDGDLSLA